MLKFVVPPIGSILPIAPTAPEDVLNVLLDCLL